MRSDITSQVKPVNGDLVTPGEVNIVKSDTIALVMADNHNLVTLDSINLVTPDKPKLVMPSNASPVMPGTTDYKSYLKDKLQSNTPFRNSFIQFTNETKKPVTQDVVGQVNTVDAIAIAHKATITDMVVTTSGTLDCPTQNIFEVLKISKFHTVTPDTLDSVMHVPSVTPDVAGTLSSSDPTSVACNNSDVDSCNSVVTQDPVQQSPVTPGIPEHIVPLLESAKERLIEHN